MNRNKVKPAQALNQNGTSETLTTESESGKKAELKKANSTHKKGFINTFQSLFKSSSSANAKKQNITQTNNGQDVPPEHTNRSSVELINYQKKGSDSENR